MSIKIKKVKLQRAVASYTENGEEAEVVVTENEDGKGFTILCEDAIVLVSKKQWKALKKAVKSLKSKSDKSAKSGRVKETPEEAPKKE